MKRILLFLFLLISTSHLFAQTELNLVPNSDISVNAQIEADRAGGTPADVYVAASGIYFWDATYLVDFDLHIKGASTDWIGVQASPPIFVPIPDGAGALVEFVQVTEGGSLTLESILFNGRNAIEGGDVLGNFVSEVGATEMILDNCCFSDMGGHVITTNSTPDLVSVTNCIIINTHNTSARPWGGHLGRFNTLGAELVIENNTVVNSGRLLGNGGRFLNTNITMNHNSTLNAQTNALELHYKQALYANNIFYNWSWMGRTPADVAYNYSMTTFETFNGLPLDSVSTYFGRNLLYRDPAIKEHYDSFPPDSAVVSPYIVWNLDVDSTVAADDNFTIGKNYWDVDPEFATGPGNLDKMLEWLTFKYVDGTEWPDWRVTSPVTYDDQGQPVVSWPPAFDLSYTNEYMVVGATDGLPVGDLNWFPDAKATYMASRDSYIAGLVDSMTMAKSLYIPGDSLSGRITADQLVSVEQISDVVPEQFYLSSNYPNPFNPSTTIKFGLPQQAMVTLSVYNILGQKVFELTENELASGSHTFNFDASSLSSGIYVYTVSATGINGQKFVDSKKMMLLK